MNNYIAYYRVSTRKQGESGLGLEAQRSIVENYAGTVLCSFTEVETGTGKRKRPVLKEALARCKETGATLVVAKLDRLARNVAFTAALLESGVDFVACDVPEANKFMIHIMAAMAEYEAKLISERTKNALQAARKRGVRLGTSGGRHPAFGTIHHTQPRELVKQMQQLREDGLTYAGIAERLNAQGHKTSRGGQFSGKAVHRIVTKYERVAA